MSSFLIVYYTVEALRPCVGLQRHSCSLALSWKRSLGQS